MIDRHVGRLMEYALDRDDRGIRRVLCDAVPEYCPKVEDPEPKEKDRVVVCFDEVRFRGMAN